MIFKFQSIPLQLVQPQLQHIFQRVESVPLRRRDPQIYHRPSARSVEHVSLALSAPSLYISQQRTTAFLCRAQTHWSSDQATDRQLGRRVSSLACVQPSRRSRHPQFSGAADSAAQLQPAAHPGG
jgi:hypothetical protein